ncbi:MAG: NAD(P)H-dependent oxidoreductase [Candidatus Pacebacteria bacterium]|nr:NAD(P)H-dependent oxidoreductase [Candidatus Paceibacterota bacterium]MDD5356561.1 NAD(P)H-dependent oxidoreductase [Candidatus Paceibacterota bacterium]
MEKLSIPVILGTAREGRWSEKVAHLMFKEIKKRSEVDSVFIDVKDYILGKTARFGSEQNEKNEAWHEVAEKADGFLFVIPEYNHSFPGEFKMFIDSLFKEYAKKPVAICGVSDGAFGGTRMIDAVRPVLSYLGMIPVNPPVQFMKVNTIFDASGVLLDESYNKKIATTLDELIQYTKAMKEVRKTLKK